MNKDGRGTIARKERVEPSLDGRSSNEGLDLGIAAFLVAAGLEAFDDPIHAPAMPGCEAHGGEIMVDSFGPAQAQAKREGLSTEARPRQEAAGRF